MTRNILLALALTLGTASFAAPAAQACGGYGFDPRESAIRQATLADAQRRAPEGVTVAAATITIDDRRATAIVHFWRGEEHLATHDVDLAFRNDHWRVTRFQRRA